jgi:hypothetical protein
VAAAPAMAYSCSSPHIESLYGAVSSLNLTYYSNCSDGRVHWSGVLSDTSCDGRAARVVLSGDQFFLLDGTYVSAWDDGFSATGGCGTSSSFSGSDFALSSPWRVTIWLGACGTTCSDWDTGYMYG